MMAANTAWSHFKTKLSNYENHLPELFGRFTKEPRETDPQDGRTGVVNKFFEEQPSATEVLFTLRLILVVPSGKDKAIEGPPKVVRQGVGLVGGRRQRHERKSGGKARGKTEQ